MQIENNGENIEVGKKYAKKITRDEMNAGDSKATRKAIFDSMDTNKDGELSTTELADMFSKLDADGDGKVTDAEINTAVDAIPNVKQAKKAEYIAYLKDMAAKNNEKAGTEAGNTYTVQLGEQYDDLITRILKSRGIENPTEEQIKIAKKQFEADNEGAFTRNADGSVKWLLAGKQVFVRTGTTDDAKDYMKDRNNASEVMEDYNSWVNGGKKAFTYDSAKPNAYREIRKAEKSSDEIVDYSKVTDSNLGNYKDKKDELKEKVDKSTKLLAQLSDKNNVKKVEKYGEDSVKVTLKDGDVIYVRYKENKVSDVQVKFKDNKTTDVGYYRDNNKLCVDMNATNKGWEVSSTDAISFAKVEALIPKDLIETQSAQTKKERKQYTQSQIDGISDRIYYEADSKSGGNAVKGMYEIIKKDMNSDNVVEIYETYKKRHTDDDSMITTMTSEWLGYGKGHGRDTAVQATTYILDLLIKRADMAGVDKNSKAYKDVVSGIDTLKNSQGVQKWINNENKDTDMPKWDIYDSALSVFAEKIIDPLIKEIQKVEK